MTSHLFSVFFYIFVFYFLTLVCYYFFCGAIAFWEVGKRLRQQRFEDFKALGRSLFTLPVSVLIPTHNEEGWILDSVRSVLQNTYPEFEVVVIDDGSTDRTLALLKEQFDLDLFYEHPQPEGARIPTGPVRDYYISRKDPRLRVLTKESGFKKAGAVNAGIEYARYRYFCILDADTVLEPDGLMKVMAHVVKDPEHIIGVGSYFGLVNGMRIQDGKIVERRFSMNPLIAYQNLEYLRSFIGTRTVWSKFNATPIIAGGFAVWRRDFMIELGGFAPEYSSEDVEITFRAQEYIRQHPESGYQLLVLPYFVGWTEGPATLKTLIQQRNRWQRCLLEAVWKYRFMIANPRYKGFGLFTLPYLVLYEALGVFFEVSSIVLTVAGFLLGAVDLRLLGAFFLFMALIQTLISLFSIFAFVRDQHPFRLRFVAYLVFLGFVEIAWYRWVQALAKTLGTVDSLRGVREFDRYTRQKKT